MKVEGPDSPAGKQKAPPEKDAFQEVLQRTGARGKAPPRPGPPPPSSAPKPGGLAPAPKALAKSAPALPGIRAQGVVHATARSAAPGSPESLRQARQDMHVEAKRLGTVRQEAHAEVREQHSQRITELLSRELERTLRAEPRPPVPTSPPARSREDKALEGPATSAPAGGHAPSGGAPASPTDATAPTTQVESTLALIEKIEVFVKSQRPALGLSLRGALEATVEVERTGPREVALRIQGRHGPVPTGDVARLRDALEARGLRLSVLRAE
jgi:hypothetical protein